MKYPAVTIALFTALAAGSAAFANTSQEGGKPGDTVKLSPKVQVVDRDWDFFQGLPCTRLSGVEPQSEREQALLERRRQQCLQQYRSFAPRSVTR